MQKPCIHECSHACCSQAGYLSCVVHRYSEASIGKRLDSCVARLGARIEVEMKPVCSSDPGRWRWRGGVDSNLQWRFRSLYVKALFVLIRHVLRCWGPRPGHLRVEAPTGSGEKGTRRCLSTSMSPVTRSKHRGYMARKKAAVYRRLLNVDRKCMRSVSCNRGLRTWVKLLLLWRAGAVRYWATWGAGASGRSWRSACSANA